MPTKEQRPKVPKFATEKEEAQWWDKNRDMVDREMNAALDDNTVRFGGPKAIVAERAAQKARPQKNITIRLPEADLDRARRQAEKRGLPYQTYVKMLLHQALDREDQRT